MYKIDEYVIHTAGGICQVKDISPLDIPGSDKNRKYYLLIPVSGRGGKFFVPTDNDSAIRKVLSKEQALELIDHMSDIDELSIDNDKLREAKYKEIIRSCDLHDLVGVLKNLNTRRHKRIEEGKKATATDEKYYKIASENLSSELSFVLGMDKDSVDELIFSKVKYNG